MTKQHHHRHHHHHHRRHHRQRSRREVSFKTKFLIFAFNVLLWFVGMALMAVALWAWCEKGLLNNFSSVTDLGRLDPVWVVMLVGVTLFVLGFAGCVGALRENLTLLKFFSLFLALIVLVEMGAVVVAFVFRERFQKELGDFVGENIKAYRDDPDLQNLIDFVQRQFSCCGAAGPADWDLNVYFNCTDGNPSSERCGVPFSCCVVDPADETSEVINTHCGYGVRSKPETEQPDFIAVRGCIQQFSKWLEGHMTKIAGVFFCIGLLQIFGVFLAQNLIGDIVAATR